MNNTISGERGFTDDVERGESKSRLLLSRAKESAKTRRGFTLMEILVVIAIIGILLAIVIASFSGFDKIFVLDAETRQIVSILDESRSLTLASKDDAVYGVHFESSRVVLFKGATYSASDPSNQITNLSSKITISSISLSGGGSDVVFERLTGELDKSGTITIALVSDASKTRVITIQLTGIVEISLESCLLHNAVKFCSLYT